MVFQILACFFLRKTVCWSELSYNVISSLCSSHSYIKKTPISWPSCIVSTVYSTFYHRNVQFLSLSIILKNIFIYKFYYFNTTKMAVFQNSMRSHTAVKRKSCFISMVWNIFNLVVCVCMCFGFYKVKFLIE